jgi:hypothetical protein
MRKRKDPPTAGVPAPQTIERMLAAVVAAMRRRAALEQRLPSAAITSVSGRSER